MNNTSAKQSKDNYNNEIYNFTSRSRSGSRDSQNSSK